LWSCNRLFKYKDSELNVLKYLLALFIFLQFVKGTLDLYLTFVQFFHFSASVPDTEMPKEQLANESLSSGDSSDYKSPSACPCVPVSLRPRVLSWLKMQQKLAH